MLKDSMPIDKTKIPFHHFRLVQALLVSLDEMMRRPLFQNDQREFL